MLVRLETGWKQALLVVTPETVVRWHGSEFGEAQLYRHPAVGAHVSAMAPGTDGDGVQLLAGWEIKTEIRA